MIFQSLFVLRSQLKTFENLLISNFQAIAIPNFESTAALRRKNTFELCHQDLEKNIFRYNKKIFFVLSQDVESSVFSQAVLLSLAKNSTLWVHLVLEWSQEQNLYQTSSLENFYRDVYTSLMMAPAFDPKKSIVAIEEGVSLRQNQDISVSIEMLPYLFDKDGPYFYYAPSGQNLNIWTFIFQHLKKNARDSIIQLLQSQIRYLKDPVKTESFLEQIQNRKNLSKKQSETIFLLIQNLFIKFDQDCPFLKRAIEQDDHLQIIQAMSSFPQILSSHADDLAQKDSLPIIEYLLDHLAEKQDGFLSSYLLEQTQRIGWSFLFDALVKIGIRNFYPTRLLYRLPNMMSYYHLDNWPLKNLLLNGHEQLAIEIFDQGLKRFNLKDYVEYLFDSNLMHLKSVENLSVWHVASLSHHKICEQRIIAILGQNSKFHKLLYRAESFIIASINPDLSAHRDQLFKEFIDAAPSVNDLFLQRFSKDNCPVLKTQHTASLFKKLKNTTITLPYLMIDHLLNASGTQSETMKEESLQYAEAIFYQTLRIRSLNAESTIEHWRDCFEIALLFGQHHHWDCFKEVLLSVYTGCDMLFGPKSSAHQEQAELICDLPLKISFCRSFEKTASLDEIKKTIMLYIHIADGVSSLSQLSPWIKIFLNEAHRLEKKFIKNISLKYSRTIVLEKWAEYLLQFETFMKKLNSHIKILWIEIFKKDNPFYEHPIKNLFNTESDSEFQELLKFFMTLEEKVPHSYLVKAIFNHLLNVIDSEKRWGWLYLHYERASSSSKCWDKFLRLIARYYSTLSLSNQQLLWQEIFLLSAQDFQNQAEAKERKLSEIIAQYHHFFLRDFVAFSVNFVQQSFSISHHPQYEHYFLTLWSDLAQGLLPKSACSLLELRALQPLSDNTSEFKQAFLNLYQQIRDKAPKSLIFTTSADSCFEPYHLMQRRKIKNPIG